MHDVVVIGAGAAGIAAALELTRMGIRPLILDVGYRGQKHEGRIEENFYEHRRKHDTFDVMIGSRHQGLANLFSEKIVPVKLTSPDMEFVTRNADRLAPITATEFAPIQSFASGGLANAWGAGLYRFTDRDLAAFPVSEADLRPYCDHLTREIGISGEDDDLTPYFGSTDDLLPPIRLSHNIGRMYGRYLDKRQKFKGRIALGHPRAGVLTQPHDGRPALGYDNLEFWQDTAAIYKPQLTLDKLIDRDLVDYRSGILVSAWTETDDGVRIDGLQVEDQREISFAGKQVIMAAGAINTSKIVLTSLQDHQTELKLLENPALQIPMVLPSSIGRKLDLGSFGLVQLNLVWESETFDTLIQGSLMEVTSPRRAEFFSSFPFAARQSLAMIRQLLPAMVVMQLFWPGSHQKPARLRLDDGNGLCLSGQPNTLDMGKIGEVLAAMRRLGAYTHPALIVRVPTGHAIHYAGTLPMRDKPGRYECDRNGRLAGTDRIHIADSATFPELPAKNMSFSMMANAMRIARDMVTGR
jgi:choline dehydrogenase-like flavoprotein